MAQATAAVNTRPKRVPMTGAQYLEGLRDGREIWLNGERVKDVTTHPGFRNGARTVARLYDALHDPEQQAVLTGLTPNGALTHKAFLLARTPQDLLARSEAMRAWSRLHFGFMGRSPDYKAGLVVSLGAWPEYFAPYTENASRWYHKLADECLYLNHVGINPMVDRSKALHEQKEIFVRAIEERDDGIVVSGAKMVGTAAAFTHYNFIFNYGAVPLSDGDTDHALVFIIPTNAPGVKLISRPSYELAASRAHPFDYPLSSRFDENDATMILDRVLVPWENIFVFRDIPKTNGFFPQAQVLQNLLLQGATRFATKLEFLTGLFLRVAESNGTIGFRGVQEKLGEAIAYVHTFNALVRDACLSPDPAANGYVAPSHRSMWAYRVQAPSVYPRMRELIELVAAGGLIQIPSSAKDFAAPELRPFLDQYYKGANMDAEQRVKLSKLVWDAIGTEFGGRHELYERNYAGNVENLKVETFFSAQADGDRAALEQLVQLCLDDYDLKGWTVPTWIGPER
jgi:4-hydroxyphenylacetate 3-monooxygenase